MSYNQLTRNIVAADVALADSLAPMNPNDALKNNEAREYFY